MKVCLCALTGFGNDVLDALVDDPSVDEVLVFTRKESGEFPYYPCTNLEKHCASCGVDIKAGLPLDGDVARRAIENFSPDLLLVATFHQKIPSHITGIPPLGAINAHPSLLPAYRGPTPTNWAIIAGEQKTGVTFHRIAEEYDRGDLLAQSELTIDGDIDGELRKRLSALAAQETGGILKGLLENTLPPMKQCDKKASYYPKVTSEKGIQLLKSGRFEPQNIERGLSPYPGIDILRK